MVNPTATFRFTLYETSFLPPQFNVGGQWAGADGWIGLNTSSLGDNGVVNEGVYIGFDNPFAESFISIFRNFDYNPIQSGNPIVTITASIAILDSDNGEFDNFEVEIWNRDVELLAQLIFDNSNLGILRGDGNFNTATGASFVNDSLQQLVLTINFATNTWSARLGSQTLFTNATFTSTVLNRTRNLGSVDFAWAPTDPFSPGDNFLLMDFFSVEADPAPAPPPPTPPAPGAPTANVTPPTGRPVLQIRKVRQSSNRRTVRVKGTASPPNGVARVTYQIGRVRAKRARGIGRWSFSSKLAPGRNKITVLAFGPDGTRSKPLRIRVNR